MNLAAALPHIHELVSGIAAYTYTSSRVNVSSAATTVQVVALHSTVFSASMGEDLSGSETEASSDDIKFTLLSAAAREANCRADATYAEMVAHSSTSSSSAAPAPKSAAGGAAPKSR